MVFLVLSSKIFGKTLLKRKFIVDNIKQNLRTYKIYLINKMSKNKQEEVLLNAVSATGAGTAIDFTGGRIHIAVSGTFVGTIQFEVSYDNGATYVPYLKNDDTILSVSKAGKVITLIEDFPVKIRANVTAYTSGSITAKLYYNPALSNFIQHSGQGVAS